VVNFGDPLPTRELTLAAAHAQSCDVMLALGSSLVVNPAAALVGLAVESEAKVALVNRGETPYDEVVGLRIEAGIGEVLPPAVARVKELRAERTRRSA
jgi:NAD-dependent deacetylase